MCKSCDVHPSAAVSWQGCPSQRSSSCGGIWLQWAWTSLVCQRCSSETSSCIYPNPASNLDGCWSESQVAKKTVNPHKTWRWIYNSGRKCFRTPLKMYSIRITVINYVFKWLYVLCKRLLHPKYRKGWKLFCWSVNKIKLVSGCVGNGCLTKPSSSKQGRRVHVQHVGKSCWLH